MTLSVWALPATPQGIRSPRRAFAQVHGAGVGLEGTPAGGRRSCRSASAGRGPQRRGTRPPKEDALRTPDLRSGASARWRRARTDGTCRRTCAGRSRPSEPSTSRRSATRERSDSSSPQFDGYSGRGSPSLRAPSGHRWCFVRLGEWATAEWAGMDLGRTDHIGLPVFVYRCGRLGGAADPAQQRLWELGPEPGSSGVRLPRPFPSGRPTDRTLHRRQWLPVWLPHTLALLREVGRGPTILRNDYRPPLRARRIKTRSAPLDVGTRWLT